MFATYFCLFMVIKILFFFFKSIHPFVWIIVSIHVILICLRFQLMLTRLMASGRPAEPIIQSASREPRQFAPWTQPNYYGFRQQQPNFGELLYLKFNILKFNTKLCSRSDSRTNCIRVAFESIGRRWRRWRWWRSIFMEYPSIRQQFTDESTNN
jgi:hypothetical protein